MSKKEKRPEDRERGYRVFRKLLCPLFKFYYTPKVIGAEKIPQDGPLIIAGNHMHVYDQCPVICTTKRTIHYMAKKEYFEGKLAPFFKITGCIPVDRSRKDLNSAKSAMTVLKRGGVVGIFPEGTRNKTDEFLLPFKVGTVSMAKKTNAYIIPFGITGDYKFRTKNLVVRFGEPFKVDDMELSDANQKLYEAIGDLMRENLAQAGK